MLRRAIRVLYRAVMLLTACIVLLVLLAALVVPVQSLPTARVGVSGRLAASPDHPVRLVMALPPGYGLTPDERRHKLPALNAEHQVEVSLEDSQFVVEMPPVKYCAHYRLWQSTPPPPAWFILRFSDAPQEEYVLWHSGGQSGYLVHGPDREIPSELASWRIEPGEFRLAGGDGPDAMWLLDLVLKPQKSPPSVEERTT